MVVGWTFVSSIRINARSVLDELTTYFIAWGKLIEWIREWQWVTKVLYKECEWRNILRVNWKFFSQRTYKTNRSFKEILTYLRSIFFYGVMFNATRGLWKAPDRSLTHPMRKKRLYLSRSHLNTGLTTQPRGQSAELFFKDVNDILSFISSACSYYACEKTLLCIEFYLGLYNTYIWTHSERYKSGWLVGWFCFTAYQPFSGHLTPD